MKTTSLNLLGLALTGILFCAVTASGQKQATPVTAGEIAAKPDAYYGAKVRVEAEVEDVLNLRAFTLDEDRFFAGPDVLVLMPRAAAGAPENQDVTVTGTLRKLMQREFVREYDWFDLDWFDEPDYWTYFSERPVIIADSVRTEAGNDLVLLDQDRRAEAGTSRQVQSAERARELSNPPTGPAYYTAGDVAASPQSFYGKRISVRAKVEDVFNQRIFTLDEDNIFAGPDLLVINSNPGRVQDGADVELTGTVRHFILTELDSDYDWFDLDWFTDDQEELIVRVRNRPVLIADQIREID